MYKVSIFWQIILWLIPFGRIWAFYRIKKLQKMIIYSIIIIAVTFVPLLLSTLVLDDSALIYTANGFFIIGYFGGDFILLYFLIKWSKQWNNNNRIDTSGLISKG